ncbi:TD and POZ domain-containing protein 3-like [Aphidius gifuensis]|uniref:TD and POZ domain-containing protein 3-like n=1 Tax=Aphidius gifuensis TaxID=684658 RepID=UPI001CDD2E01|nr:TD and POZ domain-containing protein 3-like [Aphidius gifuensis]
MANICENVDTAERHLEDDYADLLESGKSNDVIIRVETKSFKAKELLLLVLSAMFNHNELKENAENEVIVEDIDEDVFEELLYHMYTAYKYQLDHLKNQCEKALLSSINIEKATEFFVFANKNNAKNLKHRALIFIKSHLQEVLASNTFRKLEKGEGSVLCKILHAVGGGN